MQLHRRNDADEFAGEVGPFLLAREAEHNLLLGILGGIREEGGPYADVEPYLAFVRDDAGRVALVAVRTPPHNVVLSTAATTALVDPLVADLSRAAVDLPGVTCPTELAATFTSRWEEITGRTSALAVSMRIFRASHARHPSGVAGCLRQASETDRTIAMAWGRAFEFEAVANEPDDEQAQRWADRMLQPNNDRGLVIWEVDGQPVSMAGYGGPTPNGIRVFAVYTPPPLRRRGYATACVAALTERLLANGRRFCFLFTDLANPTSNAIYQWIGYRPVLDVDDRRLESTS
jgi:predicted GNAT family acetyltransferase